MRASDVPVHALGVAGIAGPVIFTVLLVVQGLLQPGYSHVQQPISALAAWPLGWVQELNFAILGVSLIAFAFGLHKAIRPGTTANKGGAGAALLAMGGVGVLVAGAFSWKMVDGVPTETPPHIVGAFTALAGTAVGFIRIAKRLEADRDWKDLASYTRVTGFAILAVFVTVGLLAADASTPLHPWLGLIQRGLFLIWFVCVIVLSRRLTRTPA